MSIISLTSALLISLGLATGAALSPAHAQSPGKACGLLSLADLNAAGVKITGKLYDDRTAHLPKGTMPWLTTDLQIDQCASKGLAGGLIPYRLAIAHAKDPLDRRGWEAMMKAMNNDDKPSADSTSESVKIGKTDCEYLSWPVESKEPAKDGAAPKRVHELYCVGYKARRQIALSFNESQKANLPAPKTVVSLLEKVMAKL